MREGRGIRIVAGGDVMLGEHPIMVGRGTATSILKNPDFNPLEGVRALFSDADISIANLESVLSDPGPGSSPSARECRGPERGIHLLKNSGLNVLNLANNHIQQHGEDAFRQTERILDSAGIGMVGRVVPGTDNSLAWDSDIGGMPVRILGYSLRPRQHFDHKPLYAEGPENRILEEIAAGKNAGRTVIVSIHWGDEFVPYPSREQVRLGRRMIDAGASLVLGHHPHVLQGWESHGGGAIVYSLGNLVFDMPWLESCRRTALFSCTLSEGGVSGVEWVPLRIGDDFVPRIPDAETAGEIAGFMSAAKEDLERGEGRWSAPPTELYENELRVFANGQRKASQKYFLKNMFRYEPGVLASVIGKFVRRRVGLLDD